MSRRIPDIAVSAEWHRRQFSFKNGSIRCSKEISTRSGLSSAALAGTIRHDHAVTVARATASAKTRRVQGHRSIKVMSIQRALKRCANRPLATLAHAMAIVPSRYSGHGSGPVCMHVRTATEGRPKMPGLTPSPSTWLPDAPVQTHCRPSSAPLLLSSLARRWVHLRSPWIDRFDQLLLLRIMR